MTRIAFDISDEAHIALLDRIGQMDNDTEIPISAVVKETLYKLLGVEVEPNAATRRRIEALATREAKMRAEREKLAAQREALNAIV